MEQAIPTHAVMAQRMRFDWRLAIVPAVLPAWCVAGLMAAFVALAVALTNFTYDAAYLNAPIASLLLLALIGMALRGAGYVRIGSGCEALALFSGLSMAAPLCAAILASTNLPLTDAMLERWDRQLFGLNRTEMALWVMQRDLLFSGVQLVYHSLIVQPSILLAVLFATGMEGRGWRLLFAWGLTLVLSIIVFALMPALGSPPIFLDYLDTLNGARDGTLRVVGREMLTGIITFPSFHAAAAVLLGWGFLRMRIIGPAMVALNALMFLSAAIASHYLVDLIGGGVIALFAIWLADKVVSAVEARGQSTQFALD